MAHSLRFYGDGISFRVVFGQPFRVFPGGARIAQTRWMLARGILGSGRTRGVSFRPFRNSSSWWWLISSIFLIRISCHKITPANGYHGAIFFIWCLARVGGFNQCASPDTFTAQVQSLVREPRSHKLCGQQSKSEHQDDAHTLGDSFYLPRGRVSPQRHV